MMRSSTPPPRDFFSLFVFGFFFTKTKDEAKAKGIIVLLRGEICNDQSDLSRERERENARERRTPTFSVPKVLSLFMQLLLLSR